jgi:hypothetical protein
MQLPPRSWNLSNQHVLSNKISAKKMKTNEEGFLLPELVMRDSDRDGVLVL